MAPTLGGLLCWRWAGEEGAEEVADDGLLLESSWLEERLHCGYRDTKHLRESEGIFPPVN